ncbi:hypothetical protein NDU88_011137 [Pleurodeles waltl]|uniref:Uncharacterized protein n=1 Tax=Pleurodeles waltl TaxID=8319 RepID=A0AAV7R270_PLEWA|nr:hypothetical protein NDU88_011137 [Pleurodeles waltl]
MFSAGAHTVDVQAPSVLSSSQALSPPLLLTSRSGPLVVVALSWASFFGAGGPAISGPRVSLQPSLRVGHQPLESIVARSYCSAPPEPSRASSQCEPGGAHGLGLSFAISSPCGGGGSASAGGSSGLTPRPGPLADPPAPRLVGPRTHSALLLTLALT